MMIKCDTVLSHLQGTFLVTQLSQQLGLVAKLVVHVCVCAGSLYEQQEHGGV